MRITTISFLLITLTLITSLSTNALFNNSKFDPMLQWNLAAVSAPAAWNITEGNDNIVIAIIDSGVDFSHPDLTGSAWVNPGEIPGNSLDDDHNGYIDDINGWDFRSNDADPSPGHSHGTFVAGCIAADGFIKGIAPKVKIMAIRFLDNKNFFYTEDWKTLAKAINYSVNNGADIINLSIEFLSLPSKYEDRLALNNSIEYAYDSGVVLVGVTGNDHGADVSYPGKYPQIIAVSSTNDKNSISYFSNVGEENEICAPGEDIYSTMPDNDYSVNSGTSFAAPLVSGTIGLMLSVNPYLEIEEIREILHNTSTDLGSKGWDPIYGYGLLNASAAVQSVPKINITSNVVSENSNSSLTNNNYFTSIKLFTENDPLLIVFLLGVSLLEKRRRKLEHK